MLTRVVGTGRQLYQAAVDMLERIVPTYWVATNEVVSTFEAIKFIVRNILHILAVMIDKSEDGRPQPLSGAESVRQVARRQLVKAGMAHGNKDALYLLAEINFVSQFF